jgi:hypothetical protein
MMSAKDDKPKNSKSGYKNPPKHSQFKKGQSGNPKGRPKYKSADKLTDIYDVLPRVLGHPVNMTIEGKKEKVSIFEACLFSAGFKAAGGNLSASKMILDMVKQAPESLRDPDTYTIRVTDDDHRLIRRLLDDAASYGADEEALKEIAQEHGVGEEEPEKDSIERPDDSTT